MMFLKKTIIGAAALAVACSTVNQNKLAKLTLAEDKKDDGKSTDGEAAYKKKLDEALEKIPKDYTFQA